MATTITARFPKRREVELAVEHLVQEYGIARADIFIEPLGSENSSGEASTGSAIIQGSTDELTTEEGSAFNGQIRVSVDMNEDEREAVTKAFQDAGALEVTAG